MARRILLVEPDFPIPPKSKNHKNFFPVGLLKIASYLRANGVEVKFLRGLPTTLDIQHDVRAFQPDEIWVTSLFTYWAKYVRDAVQAYRKLAPMAKLVVGGIFASLLPKEEVKSYTTCDEVLPGVYKPAERYLPAYDLVEPINPHPIDYQILHTSRGCERKCRFCGTWKIEPEFKAKSSIKNEIHFKKLVFYDNNFLANPHVESIMAELIELRSKHKILWCEAQSGFDGRILLEKPHVAKMLKAAGFRYPRIAWDWGYDQHRSIKKQIDLLLKAGYASKELFAFVLYDWDIPFDEMERKRIKCWQWQIQIADCRYRPLDQLYDNYNPRAKEQTPADYHIHEEAGWTDSLVRQFRRNVREQNICVRHGFPFYSRSFERKQVGKEVRREVKQLGALEKQTRFMERLHLEYWNPSQVRMSNPIAN